MLVDELISNASAPLTGRRRRTKGDSKQGLIEERRNNLGYIVDLNESRSDVTVKGDYLLCALCFPCTYILRFC